MKVYLEGLMICERVDDDKALSVLDVEIAHACKLFRPSRVQDLQHARTTVHLDFLQKQKKGQKSSFYAFTHARLFSRVSLTFLVELFAIFSKNLHLV